ncbi:hypothetical protein ABIB25_000954 [Nakamurella sp. UYEF19]|uniref:hypothetical protein n=1 Tax=Nakamurella sp. UYEF19 TaxID=1756392 RepID=UPI003397D6C9
MNRTIAALGGLVVAVAVLVGCTWTSSPQTSAGKPGVTITPTPLIQTRAAVSSPAGSAADSTESSSTGDSTESPGTTASTSAATPGGVSIRSLSSTTPVARGGVQVLTAAPRPPRTTPNPSDFLSPTAVAAAYLAAWCYQPLTKPANQNIAQVMPWMTALGWAQDKSRGITGDMWEQTVKAGLTSICGPVQATESTDAPTADGMRWVSLLTRRAYVAGNGKIVGQQNLAQTRRVLRASNGQWFVDISVNAG